MWYIYLKPDLVPFCGAGPPLPGHVHPGRVPPVRPGEQREQCHLDSVAIACTVAGQQTGREPFIWPDRSSDRVTFHPLHNNSLLLARGRREIRTLCAWQVQTGQLIKQNIRQYSSPILARSRYKNYIFRVMKMRYRIEECSRGWMQRKEAKPSGAWGSGRGRKKFFSVSGDYVSNKK